MLHSKKQDVVIVICHVICISNNNIVPTHMGSGSSSVNRMKSDIQTAYKQIPELGRII